MQQFSVCVAHMDIKTRRRAVGNDNPSVESVQEKRNNGVMVDSISWLWTLSVFVSRSLWCGAASISLQWTLLAFLHVIRIISDRISVLNIDCTVVSLIHDQYVAPCVHQCHHRPKSVEQLSGHHRPSQLNNCLFVYLYRICDSIYIYIYIVIWI